MLHGLHAWARSKDAEYMADISGRAVITEVDGEMFDTVWDRVSLAVLIPAIYLDIVLRPIASTLADI